MQYRINLTGGVPFRQVVQGRTFVLTDTGAAISLDIKIEIEGFAVEEVRNVKKGFKLRAPSFTGCVMLAPVDCVVEIVTSFADISINYSDGGNVEANINSQTIEIVVKDADVNAVINHDPVPVTAISNFLIKANMARKSLRICNVGNNPVAIGGAGVTWAQRCIVIFAGDTYFEDRAPGLAWHAVTEAGTAASVTMQELNA